MIAGSVRVARHTARLEAAVAFYRDGVGLPQIGACRDHAIPEPIDIDGIPLRDRIWLSPEL